MVSIPFHFVARYSSVLLSELEQCRAVKRTQ